MTDVYTLEALINKKFPDVWLKPGSHMGYSDKSLISGEGSTHKGAQVFDYWSQDWTEKLYRMKVLIEFADFVDQHGYYCEWVDSGTVAISPM